MEKFPSNVPSREVREKAAQDLAKERKDLERTKQDRDSYPSQSERRPYDNQAVTRAEERVANATGKLREAEEYRTPDELAKELALAERWLKEAERDRDGYRSNPEQYNTYNKGVIRAEERLAKIREKIRAQ